MSSEIVLAADLGGTNLRMATIDSQGNILYRLRRETPNSGESGEEIVRAIADGAAECLENCSSEQVRNFSAAIPGTIDFANGTIKTSPNLPGLDNFQIVSKLEKVLGKRIFIENDANAAALGEQWLGASKNSTNSVCVTLGTGVGGGIIIDGKVLHGHDGRAGEVGHICVEPFGFPCRCGSRGCVEQYASASAIVRLTKELQPLHSSSRLGLSGQIKAHDVFDAGINGDKLAVEVFRQVGFYLGIMILNLINILNCEIIVIGGGASAGWDLFAPEMKKTIYERAYGGRSEQTKIVLAELGDDAGILGAARIAFLHNE